MEHITSVGIIPYTFKDGEILFFAGHPGGNKTNYWSLLKGQVEGNEDYIDTALREFKEESSVDLSEYKEKLLNLGDVQQSKNKTVLAFALRLPSIMAINPNKCRSNMADGCPWPEISKYAWMTYDEIISTTHKTHIRFYNEILDLERTANYLKLF